MWCTNLGVEVNLVKMYLKLHMYIFRINKFFGKKQKVDQWNI